MALIDRRIDYEVSQRRRPARARGRRAEPVRAGPDPSRRVRIALTVLDYDDLRGALRGDARGQPQRGDLAALNALRAAP